MARKFEKQVRRGRALLTIDELDWKSYIREPIDMQNPEMCIFGQLYGRSYSDTYDTFSKTYNLQENFGEDWDVEFGFDINEKDPKKEGRLYKLLTEEWKRQLS